MYHIRYKLQLDFINQVFENKSHQSVSFILFRTIRDIPAVNQRNHPDNIFNYQIFGAR